LCHCHPATEEQNEARPKNRADEYGRRIVANETNENRDPPTSDIDALRKKGKYNCAGGVRIERKEV